jgi:hypothetical protein
MTAPSREIQSLIQKFGKLIAQSETKSNCRILVSFLDLKGVLQTLWNFTAGAMLLVFLVPLDALLQRCLGRHLVLCVPKFVHEAIPLKVAYRAIKYISQLSVIAAATKSAKQ